MKVGFLVLLLTYISFALGGDPSDLSTDIKRPALEAIRITSPIVIDGKLTESEWQRAGISSFTQRDPNEGKECSEKTEVWVAYDDEALYVAARMHDSPDSITSRLGRRDVFLDADRFYFAIDSYHDKRTGFYFMVYSSGSMVDGTLYNDSWDDNSWDGVWDAVTNVDSDGWTVEMKIPYSQIRFPKLDEYVWGVNFGRNITRKQESSYYVMVPKKESGWVSRFADLNGIRDISPPSRLEILPYVVSGLKNTNLYDENDPFHKATTVTGNVGADIKMGIGNNFTLNAAINPDFGQVEVDPAVVNLSQFETFFSEKRPFFIEGSNFFDFGYGGANNNWGFNWGGPQYFYSRRIGRSPNDPDQHSGYVDLPNNTTILGAAKLTGKLTDNFSLGGLAAATEREYAEVDDGAGNRYSDVAEPFTTYGVLRGLNEFNEGKQAIGFIATGVKRDLNESYLEDKFNKDAYSFGLDAWTNLDSAQTWVLTGWGSTTLVRGTTQRMINVQQSPLHYFQRPDADYLDVDSNATSLAGYASRIALNKQKGNWKFNSAVGIITSGFETNDLGFTFRTDQINMHLVSGYRWYDPNDFFRNMGFNIATMRNFDFDGNKFGEGYFFFYDITFLNFWSIDGNFQTSRSVLDRTYTRGGPWIRTPASYYSYINISSDSRTDLVGYLYVDGARSEGGASSYNVNPQLQWKINTNLNVSFSPSYWRNISKVGWITSLEDPTATETFNHRYVFSSLDQHEISGSIRMDWTFTPKLSLQLYLQPLISTGEYRDFKELKAPRVFDFNQYGVDNGSTISYDPSSESYSVDPDGSGPATSFSFDNPDFNYKSLRGNAVLRWEYMPGSSIYFVWTRTGDQFDNHGEFDFNHDIGDLIRMPNHDDNFLIKIAYWWNP